MRNPRRAIVVALAALVLSACIPTQPIIINVEPDPTTPLVRVSIGSISVTGVTPGSDVRLFGKAQRRAQADELGAVVFRNLAAGRGYGVEAEGIRQVALTVPTIESSTPRPSFYSGQRLQAGYQYIRMRDGTTLSATVYLPPGPGPFPTVVEYSGYDESKPGRNYQDAIVNAGIPLEQGCRLAPYLCVSPFGKGILAAMFDFAVVNVNVRGTGCSGGSFELLTDQFRADGYDIIETVAAQPWVAGNRVGMVGGSFHGFSQIAVASTRPPSLAAITPEVPLKDAIRDLAAPGAIPNIGFAKNWTAAVEEGARPYGQGWERAQADSGDAVCAQNQVLHGQAQDLLSRFDDARYYPDDLSYLDLTPAAAKIEVPVFLTADWQDEQVGAAAAGLCEGFVRAPVRKCVFANGFHGDQNPDMLVEWKAFLDFYVRAKREPISPVARFIYPLMMEYSLGVPVQLPAEEPFVAGADTDTLRRRYEAAPGVKLLLDVGDAGQARATTAGAVATYATWPPSGLQVSRYRLGGDGALRTHPAALRPAPGPSSPGLSFRASNALGQQLVRSVRPPAGSTSPIDVLRWTPERAGEAAVFLTDPLTADRLLVGPARADLWVRSSADGADLGITLSEVAPDGTERFIQAGTARVELAVPGPGATALDPAVTGAAGTARPVRAGVWQQASVRMLPFAHLLRAGSRLKVSVHSPGGDFVSWAFDPDPRLGGVEPTIDIGTGGTHQSTINVGSVAAPVSRPLPACGVLRAQACRTYTPYQNTPATP